MPKWVKFIIAIFLLPVCAGGALALLRVLWTAGDETQVWAPVLAGAACWFVVFLMLPKPMLIYVFGHELTHVVWVWLFGGKVKKFKATSEGGQVVITKQNFLIALAPYFFPLYAVLVVAGFALGHVLWGWTSYRVWFHLVLGAAYSFHVTLTFHILKSEQSDITQHGYMFSAVIIFLGNITVLILGITLLTPVSTLDAFAGWLRATANVLQRMHSLFSQ